MKKLFAVAVFVVAVSLIVPASVSAQSTYEGTAVCGMCHKTEKQGQQLKIWQDSQHSKAYKTLQTPEADKIAADKGFKTKAVETPECLTCHTTGTKADKALFGAKYKVEEGVQCESCHGAGSAYKSMAVMKNRTDAIAKGMVVHEDKAKYCVGCHNSASPTFKGFKLDEMWAKIAHKVPKG